MAIRCLFAPIATAMILLCSPLAVHAREVRVLCFSFEIPDSWVVEGSGGGKLFASGAKQAHLLPLILGEACVPSRDVSCLNFQPPNPPVEFPQQGCAAAIPQRFAWPNAISETRWVCASGATSRTDAVGGFSIFTFKDSMLYVAYLAGETDAEVSDFLDQLARSLAVKP